MASQRAEREERGRREGLAKQRGIGGVAARTRGMADGVAPSDSEWGWETVMERARGDEEMRRQIELLCIRSVEGRRWCQGRRHGARRSTTTAAMSAAAVEQMCERAGVSTWRRAGSTVMADG